jgi:hypothetical protein
MKVTINNREYDFEFDSVWGPLYLYEEIAGDTLPFDARKTLCMHVLWWCILVRCNKDFTLQLQEFLLALNDMELAKKLREYYAMRMEVLNTGTQLPDEGEGESKKKD